MKNIETGSSAKTGDDLVRALSGRFPVLRKKLSGCNSLGFVVEIVAIYLNETIRAHDVPLTEALVKEMLWFYEHGDADLKNAFYTDFCEVLDLRNDYGRELFRSFPEDFQKLYRESQAYIGQPY